MKKQKIRGTAATYKAKDGYLKTDLVELAKAYQNYGQVPQKIGDARAMEIALLAQAFLKLYGKR